MIHPISPLGIIHTIISLVPVIAGIYSFARYYMIDPKTNVGKIYLISLVLAVITSFGVSSTGGLNVGHAAGIVILFFAFGAVYVTKLSFLGKLRPYLSVFGFSFSFFLSLVPGINETLTRVPLAHPLADAPMSPLILNILTILFTFFVVGYIAQCLVIRTRNKGKA